MIHVRSARARGLLALGLVLALFAPACASDLGSPFFAVVIAFDAKNQTYRLAQGRVTTLSSLQHLEGTSGNLRGGGSVEVDTTKVADPQATVGSLSAKFIAVAPEQVSLWYSVVNEIVRPEDFVSLELLSTYFNVERARAMFTTWGLTNLPAAPLYAHATLEDERGLSPLKPGELFYPPMGTYFFPVASETAQQLPVHFNLGAMAHAVTLQALQLKAWGGRPQDPATYLPTSDPDRVVARHIWQSVGVGLADFLGAAAGEDPRWFEKSIAQEAAARNLDQLRCSDASWLPAIEADDRPGSPPYDPYPLGTVLAAALWEEASADGLKAAATDTVASLTALGDVASQNGGKLSLTTALDTLVAGANDDRKPSLCGLFKDRFRALSVTSLPACSGVTDSSPLETCQ